MTRNRPGMTLNEILIPSENPQDLKVNEIAKWARTNLLWSNKYNCYFYRSLKGKHINLYRLGRKLLFIAGPVTGEGVESWLKLYVPYTQSNRLNFQSTVLSLQLEAVDEVRIKFEVDIAYQDIEVVEYEPVVEEPYIVKSPHRVMRALQMQDTLRKKPKKEKVVKSINIVNRAVLKFKGSIKPLKSYKKL